MPIRIQCPSPECRATCTANESLSGRQVRCPKCGKPYLATPTLDGRSGDTGRGRPAVADNPFPVLPAEFGRYRVLRLLGQGGMGAVYVAHDTELDREVALKLPFFGSSDSSHRAERFVREARAAAVLQHPNICTVFDAGRIDGRAFLTMALIEGTTLDALIDPDAPLPQPRAAAVVRDIALALEHAHRKGVVHRDLKPSNVMVRADGTPVVMDFGLAKRAADADPAEAKLTRDGGVIGTPGYMSPEQVRGEVAAVGPPSDVYSLGVMLFEVLTGHVPYTGSLGAVMGQILSAPVPPVRELRPDADERLEAVCRTAMAKNPAERFPTMAAMAQALGEYLKPPAAETEIDVVLVGPSVVAPSPRGNTTSPFEQLGEAPAATRVPGKTGRGNADAPAGSRSAPAGVRAVSKAGRWRLAVLALVLVPLLVWLGAVVLRVETPNGTLVVEIDDPAVEARIKDGKLVLSGPDGKDRYTLTAGERDTKIDAGAYKVRVEGADGLALDTPEFTLKKGGRVTVRVTLEPKAVAKKPTPRADGKKAPDAAATDPDRRAANYVLSVGGVVRVNDEVGDLKAVGDLPRQPFRLTHIDLTGNTKIRNADLVAFLGCANLKTLKLEMTPVGDEGLAYFKESKGLTDIELTGAPVGDAGVVHFKDCKQLKVLHLGRTGVTDQGLLGFTGCTNLTSLKAHDMRVGDDGMSAFRDCDKLETLVLCATQVSDTGLGHFKNCKGLKLLDVGDTRVLGPGLAHFKGCTKLEDLGVFRTAVGDEGVAHLKDCKNLKNLHLQGSQVGDSGLAVFAGCADLTHLNLGGTKVGDEGMTHLKNCTRLKWVYLNDTRVGDAGMGQLKTAPSLARLTVSRTRVTAGGVKDMKKALPNCDIEWDDPAGNE